MSNFIDDLSSNLKDPEYAAAYIAAAMEENDNEFLQVALGDVVKSHGVSKISGDTGITREALYRMISNNGNPTLKSLTKLLDSLGLQISISAKSSTEPAQSA